MNDSWGLAFQIKNDINVVSNFQKAMNNVFMLVGMHEKSFNLNGKELNRILGQQMRVLESMFV
jgi:hypothetical protein